MLAIFRKALAHPPEELKSSGHGDSGGCAAEILSDFCSSHALSLSASFSTGAALAAARADSVHQRLFCSVDNVYCIFVGRLDNLSSLIRQYGLSGKSFSDESLLLIEAYRTLRDRGPYPADQVVKDLAGSFAFVVFDSSAGSVFAALVFLSSSSPSPSTRSANFVGLCAPQSGDGKMPLYWGIAAEGSAVISDEVEVVKRGCGKSFAPFPPGCMFHSEGGLKSFEQPMNKMKAMPRVDSEGAMCGAFFRVDSCSKIRSMPRVGSAANWSSWEEMV